MLFAGVTYLWFHSKMFEPVMLYHMLPVQPTPKHTLALVGSAFTKVLIKQVKRQSGKC